MFTQAIILVKNECPVYTNTHTKHIHTHTFTSKYTFKIIHIGINISN